MSLNIDNFLQQHSTAVRFLIAYSGGVDSHVLLHLCASLPIIKNKLIAVYVHHGLQAEAEAWGRHCQATAEALGIGFVLLRVNAVAEPGVSPEEAARNARYQALKSLMATGDVLLLAQHQDDQLETVLLQLFRGSGLKGLSGMPESIAFGPGVMVRPLLNVSKQAIDDYARTNALQWVEDPSNKVSDYDRNFLRNDILPQLTQRWPALAKTVARSAAHCAQAQDLVSAMACELFLPIFDETDHTLNIKRLQALEPAKRQLVIRHWFGWLGLRMPAQTVIEQLFSDVLAARDDSDPVLAGQGYCLRRYRDKLFCLTASEPGIVADARWDYRQPTLQIGTSSRLSWSKASQGILFAQWQQAVIEVRFRSGGEKIRLPHRQGRHELKKLFQEAGIPPWQRPGMPLVYLDGQLAAVGDRWISAEFYSEQADGCIRLSLSTA